MRNIKVFIPLWKRPKITEICFLGLKRLRKKFNLSVLAVISEEEMKGLCERYGVDYVMTDNTYLGRKKNFGLKALKDSEFDYLLEIGSDDLILDELIEDYQTIGHDFFGIQDIAFYDTESGDCVRHQKKSTLYGAGRMISRNLIEKFDFNLWDDKLNRGMDNSSHYKLCVKGKARYFQVPVGEHPKVLSLKSDVNLWPFNYFNGRTYDPSPIFEKLSSEEVSRIKSLKCVTVES